MPLLFFVWPLVSAWRGGVTAATGPADRNAAAIAGAPAMPFARCAVQCCGGRGNESGDGASKHLLLAKCKFGGDEATPAGDANVAGVDDDEWPPGLMRLLPFAIGIDGDEDAVALGGD